MGGCFINSVLLIFGPSQASAVGDGELRASISGYAMSRASVTAEGSGIRNQLSWDRPPGDPREDTGRSPGSVVFRWAARMVDGAPGIARSVPSIATAAE
ncbi:hypothetical protein GCM10023194_46900 [Planotetraspora phitsanulokensis]|uniref:Uncharacterized protein n=1 Tax=Planotetraspora phitsanulokensis TaxID=575192 RepID=A0A8J3URB3_9ACTN|nr:hypothetical protein Pph01_82180 [Planotetraspora phitsanulokensis]